MEDGMTANGFMQLVRDSLADLKVQVTKLDKDNRDSVKTLKEDFNLKLSETEQRLNDKIDKSHFQPCDQVNALGKKVDGFTEKWARLDEQRKSMQSSINFWKKTCLWAGGIVVTLAIAIFSYLINGGGA